jgi:hypothetical protein
LLVAVVIASQLAPIPAAAQQPAAHCTPEYTRALRLTLEDCTRLADGARQPRQMIYQDRDVQVLLVREGATRTGSTVEATLVLNFPNEEAAAKSVRSLQRRQRVDCRAGARAVLDEQAYEAPAARGQPVSSKRTPDAALTKPEAGSIDAAVVSALCPQASR